MQSYLYKVPEAARGFRKRARVTRDRSSRRSAFTLVELVVVVLILGILAAAAVGNFSDLSEEVLVSSMRSDIRVISDQIELHNQLDGQTVQTVDPSWFRSGNLPRHPQNKYGVPSIHVLIVDDRSHPASKVLKAGVPGAYWYNPISGTVRARIADQGSQAKTLALYNLVNQSNETALGNYGGGGGGGS